MKTLSESREGREHFKGLADNIMTSRVLRYGVMHGYGYELTEVKGFDQTMRFGVTFAVNGALAKTENELFYSLYDAELHIETAKPKFNFFKKVY